MLVKHFMSPKIITIPQEMTCYDAYRMLREHKIRRAPVTGKKEKLVGIISERDLLRILPGTAAQASTTAGEAGMEITVEKVMSKELHILFPYDHLDKAVAMMLKYKIGGIPVVDKEDNLEGILTESDIFKALWGFFSYTGGTRLLFQEAMGSQQEHTDPIALCNEYECIVNALLRHHLPEGSSMYYLCIEGDRAQELIEALRRDAFKVLLVEQNE